LPLALQFGLRLDLQAVEREIDRQDTLTDGNSLDVALARFSLALTKQSPRETADYIQKHKPQLERYLNPFYVAAVEIEMMANSGQADLAEQRLQQLPHQADLVGERGRLERLIAEARGANPVEAREEEFKKSDSLADLANLVHRLVELRDWPRLVTYGGEFFNRTHGLSALRAFGEALFETKAYDDLLTTLGQHPDLVAQSSFLASLRAWALFRTGDLDAAREALAQLRAARDDANDRILQVNLAIASGDWTTLGAFVEHEWDHRSDRTAGELLRAGQLARQLGSARARELIIEAAARADDDPDIYIGCYGAAVSAGWEDSQTASWLERAAILSGDNGPVKRLSFKDIVDLHPEWQARETRTTEQLLAGDLPIFAAGHLLHRTLFDLFMMPALANPEIVDPRRRTAVYAYSAARGLFRSPIVHEVLRSPGQPLDTGMRTYFEPLLLRDLSAVRVHTGPDAAGAAHSIDAEAFTAGRHIAFGAGRYAPGSEDGRRLLAHELVHVVQQAHGAASLAPSGLSSPDDTAEREADAAAEALVAGRPVSPRAAPLAAVGRKVLNNVRLETLRAGAGACIVHMHGEEKTAKSIALELYNRRCVNYVHLDTTDRPISYEIAVKGVDYSCAADPNRVFTPNGRKGLGGGCVKKGSGTDQPPKDIETEAVKEITQWVATDWGAGISKCRNGKGTADLAGPLPVLALHNNTGGDVTDPLFERPAYTKQWLKDDPALGPGATNPSYIDPKHKSDAFFLTDKADYAAVKPFYNVILQNVQAGGDDGSISVALQKDRFINIDKRGEDNTALVSPSRGFSGHDEMYIKDYAMAVKALQIFGVPDGPCGSPVVPTTPTSQSGQGTPAQVPDAGTQPAPDAGTPPAPDAAKDAGADAAKTSATAPYPRETVNPKTVPMGCLTFPDLAALQTHKGEWDQKLSRLPVMDVLNWILGAWDFEKGTPKAVPQLVSDGVSEVKRQRGCLLDMMVRGVTAQKGNVPAAASNLVDSGQRSFAGQQSIWDEKFSFTRGQPFDKISSFAATRSKGLLTAGNQWDPADPTHRLMWGVLSASTTSKDPAVEAAVKAFVAAGAVPLKSSERETEILQASSAPGVSRHHAATDFDIGDATIKSPDQLQSKLWQPGKKYFDLGRWLFHNAATWGFMRPFESKGGYGTGYMAEEWHWSYWPIAQALLDFARRTKADIEKALKDHWGSRGTPFTQFQFIWNAWTNFLNNVDETPRF
jgi:hypothetical protein